MVKKIFSKISLSFFFNLKDNFFLRHVIILLYSLIFLIMMTKYYFIELVKYFEVVLRNGYSNVKKRYKDKAH